MTATLVDTSLEAFATELTNQGLGPRTVQAYVADLEGFFASHTFTPGAVLSDSMRDYLVARRGTVAPSTLRRSGVSFKRYLRYLDQPIGKLATYRMPPLPPAAPHPLEGGIGTARRLIKSTTGARRVAIALGALAGLRVSESTSVQYADIDWRTMKLTVLGKGEKIRVVPVSSELAKILRSAPKKGPLAPLTTHQVRHELDQQARIHSLGSIGSHDLRATFATTLYEKTKDIMLVSRLLGHSSVATTQVYLGFNAEDAAAAVEF